MFGDASLLNNFFKKPEGDVWTYIYFVVYSL